MTVWCSFVELCSTLCWEKFCRRNQLGKGLVFLVLLTKQSNVWSVFVFSLFRVDQYYIYPLFVCMQMECDIFDERRYSIGILVITTYLRALNCFTFCWYITFL